MKTIATLIFTVITVKAAYDAGDRIVGGQTAIPAQFPHQVSLRTRNGHFCGGSILNSNTILTAAHCVYGNNPQDFYVVVGTNSLYSGGTSYYVSRVIWHSNYNPQYITNDVAIIKLQRDIQFNQFTRPISLAADVTTEGQELILSGWGLTSFPGNIPSQLQYIRLHSLDLSECSQQLQGTNPITGSHVCTESMGVGFGACRGDSGGPLIDQNQRQVGIVSWGVPCAKGYPDVFTSVYYYKRWIESNM